MGNIRAALSVGTKVFFGVSRGVDTTLDQAVELARFTRSLGDLSKFPHAYAHRQDGLVIFGDWSQDPKFTTAVTGLHFNRAAFGEGRKAANATALILGYWGFGDPEELFRACMDESRLELNLSK